MLSRSVFIVRQSLSKNIRCFSSAAYNGWSERQNTLESEYPGLFSDKFIDEQRSLLSDFNSSNLSSDVERFNSCRQRIYEQSGEDIFQTIDVNDITSNPPLLVTNIFPTDETAKAKLEEGQTYMDNLQIANERQTNSLEESNLKMIEVAEWADKIQDWKLFLEDPPNDSSDMGLPINDEELDEWVKTQYARAPDSVRRPAQSHEEALKLESEWMSQLDDRLADEVLSNDPNFDRENWNRFCQITNEMFHPHNIDHYGYSNYAKLLFRAALWIGDERLTSVEESVRRLETLFEDSRDNDTQILRLCYEQNEVIPFKSMAALHLRICDPLFSARLVSEVRNILCRRIFDRAVKDITRDFELPIILNEKQMWERHLEKSGGSNNAPIQHKINQLSNEANSFDIDTLEIEKVLDDVLPQRLWNNDISLVKRAIIDFANGNGSLSDINNAIDNTLNPGEEDGSLSSKEILSLMVQSMNARSSDRSNYNFEAILFEANARREKEDIIYNRRLVRNKLEELNLDPLVVNLGKLIVENRNTDQMSKIIEDFYEIMKKYRGELDGTVSSAIELSESEFERIKDAIESQNVGKKITLDRVVDASLQAGFVVKIGVTKFDFSLATHIDEQRRAL